MIFVPSATSGKPMILDAQPQKRIIVVAQAGPHLMNVTEPKAADAVARVVNTYADHHSTCPAVAKFKRKG